jgi:hypothetical protein
MRVPDVKVVPARTIILPVTAIGYDLDDNDEHSNEGERTRALERTVAVEFERQARQKGALPLSFEKVRACGDNCVSLLSTAIRWGAKSTTEIAVAHAGTNRSGKSSVGEWRNSRDFRPLQRALEADFALVLFVRDAHETAGRQFAEAQLNRRAFKSIRNDDDFTQIAATCALELASGRIVWCSSMAARWMGKYADITSINEYPSVVKELLADF